MINNKNIIIIMGFLTIFVLFVGGVILDNSISYNDETILLRETINVNQGLKIYKNINVLTTPLFFYIGAVIMKLLGNNLFSFRVYGILIMTLYIIMLFYVMRNLKICNKLIYITIATILLLQQNVIKNGANYNFLAITFSLLSMSLMIKKDVQKNNAYYIIQGIMLFLVYMIKQNIGIYHCIAFFICEIFIEKYEKKKKIKNLLYI